VAWILQQSSRPPRPVIGSEEDVKQLNGKRVIIWESVLDTLKNERIFPRVLVHAISEPNITLPARNAGDVRIMYRYGHRTLDILYGESKNKIHIKSVEVAD
jgi:hypothetical protein